VSFVAKDITASDAHVPAALGQNGRRRAARRAQEGDGAMEILSALLQSVASIIEDTDLTKRERGTFLRETVRQYNEYTGRDALADIAAISKNEPATPFWDSLEGRYFSTVTNGAGPMTAQIRERYELICRGNPLVSGEVCFAEAWNELSDDDRDAILQEEASEVARIAAEQEARANETDSERRTRIRAAEAKHTEKKAMTRDELAAEISKKGALVVSRAIIDSDEPGLTEQEFTKIIKSCALRDRRSGETDAQAFTRLFEGGDEESRTIRAAHQLTKRFYPKPSQAALKAYGELVAKADELRRKETGLTREQAFAKAYTDPANLEIVKRERAENRPWA
jgi:predicted Fe-S protein YdhL (DUF1289 family)